MLNSRVPFAFRISLTFAIISLSMHDIALALMAVQTQTRSVLDTFPTIPVVQEAENPEVTIPQEA